MDNNKLKIIFAVLVSSLILSCGKKGSNVDFDFSTLNKPIKTRDIDTQKTEEENYDKKLFVKDLVPFENREQILSKTKFGKRDPFSKNEIQINKLNSNLKFTGLLNTALKKHAFVSYLNNEGSITEGSVGGVNTNLLPNGAKVIDLDSKNMKLTIEFKKETFIFELQN